MRARQGSVVKDKRSNVWNFFWWAEGKRHSKVLGKFPTKSAAWRAAKPLRDAAETESKPKAGSSMTISTLVEQYRKEKMPTRIETRRSYNSWFENHIIPKWGECCLSDLQARPVEMWLEPLTLSPKSKTHIRGLLSVLWDFAMWAEHVPTQRNPMELVTVKGCSIRVRKPRSLTAPEFQAFVRCLHAPFDTLALLCVCLGLRISEALALKWSDVDESPGRLTVERGIVKQNVDAVKTPGSEKTMILSPELLSVLLKWKQETQFSGQGDWIFASPAQVGRLPWSYKQVWRAYKNGAAAAGIAHLGTHSLRHTYRSWLDAVGTGLAVQQRMMRHASITTTMNIYGDVVTDEMTVAGVKVAGLALNGREAAGNHL
jgi:integrase